MAQVLAGGVASHRGWWELAIGIAVQLAAAAAAAAAQPLDDYINPDRPGLADGSNVVGAGRVQVETGLQWEYRSRNGAQSRTLFLPTLLRLGLDENLEFRIESNTYTRTTETDPMQGTVRAEGIAPASVGLKYHFIDSLGWQQPSIGAIVRVSHDPAPAVSRRLGPPATSGSSQTGISCRNGR